jgi:hypothetical protein
MDSDARVIRGAEPIGHIELLKKAGITDVIIFKENNSSAVVEKEISELKHAGYSSSQIHHIPMKWKQIKNFRTPCEQTIQALKTINDVLKDQSRKVFFHCTVGEDRTGMLAGIYRLLFENWDVEKSFGAEMCYHGYADGNSKKPSDVAKTVDENLTPVYARIAFLIKQKKLTRESLDVKWCAQDPFDGASPEDVKKYSLDQLNCPH